MFESTFWSIENPSTLGPCSGGYFHFILNKNPKKIGSNLLDFKKDIVYLIYENWVSIIY